MSSSQPSRATCDLVDARDGWRCFRCGASLHATSGSRHHRQLRRHGDHRPSNLVLLCGSGTTGCHGWAHANPRAARHVGLIVPGWARSEFVPAKSGGGWRRLVPDGTMLELDEQTALQMMRDLGMLV